MWRWPGCCRGWAGPAFRAQGTPQVLRSAAYNLRMSYYKHHAFFCLNQRKAGEECCADHNAQAAFDHCKARVKQAGLAGPGGVRVNKAGCLDRCAGGPVIVIYPEETWYTYVDQHDLDEIVDSHLVKGQVVERLRLPPDIGR
jgi:(2Fe-2S) ferredoxin